MRFSPPNEKDRGERPSFQKIQVLLILEAELLAHLDFLSFIYQKVLMKLGRIYLKIVILSLFTVKLKINQVDGMNYGIPPMFLYIGPAVLKNI